MPHVSPVVFPPVQVIHVLWVLVLRDGGGVTGGGGQNCHGMKASVLLNQFCALLANGSEFALLVCAVRPNPTIPPLTFRPPRVDVPKARFYSEPSSLAHCLLQGSQPLLGLCHRDNHCHHPHLSDSHFHPASLLPPPPYWALSLGAAPASPFNMLSPYPRFPLPCSTPHLITSWHNISGHPLVAVLSTTISPRLPCCRVL